MFTEKKRPDNNVSTNLVVVERHYDWLDKVNPATTPYEKMVRSLDFREDAQRALRSR